MTCGVVCYCIYHIRLDVLIIFLMPYKNLRQAGGALNTRLHTVRYCKNAVRDQTAETVVEAVMPQKLKRGTVGLCTLQK